ncbi:dihydroorotate dehydrogenase electron transfer subunit [Candidatus Bathyarchaeota archaeon]|nr:dihydroorotate dehydrogenase electron transfer subunit [Candidatus Bathyarchaeota archaeon]
MSGWHTDANQLRTVSIQKVVTETELVKTLYFRDKHCASAKPGQFIMVWIPGVDEIPLSISSINGSLVSITVKEVGEATRTLNRMREGGLIGVRGPFGTHYKVVGKSALIVGGGVGTAPLMLLTSRLAGEKVKAVVVEGAKTRSELLFVDQLVELQKNNGFKAIFTTDDGSYGTKGLVTDATEKLLSTERFDIIYACGNEAMTTRIFELAEKYGTPLQASLERFMYCAMGICGSCVIGKYRVCRDGPVFNQTQLKEVEDDLGKIKLDPKGEKVKA